MQKLTRRTKIVVTVVIVALVAGGLTAEILTSSAPGDPCSGIVTPTSTVGGATSPTQTVSSHARASASPTVHPGTAVPDDSSSPIPVVAAENFWGSLVSQLGGNQTNVTSIVTDPNTDPHEYEASATVAQEISNAQFVIVNGVGYDQWAISILQADGNSAQVVLNVGDRNGVSVNGGIVSGNPHMWYNPLYVNATVAAMYSDLVSIRPSATAYFQAQYAALNVSLGELYGQAAAIRDHFAGTVVASTESIFVYLANFTHLDLVSPPEFMEAVAEGNDPPPQSVVEFQCQLESGHVRVLVFNAQTVTPVTDSMKSIAASNNVTVIGITETVQPPTYTFQQWMGAEYLQLYNALNANALGQ
jgi:zinc/manganese transport system substrate-binding protein